MATSDYITIALTQGQFTIIDVDLRELTNFNWFAAYRPHRNKYVSVRNMSLGHHKQKSLLMHRCVMEIVLGRPLLKHEQVDHINNDPLDNRKMNLRLATSAENSRNRLKPLNNTSGYKGVSWYPRYNKWMAYISYNGKRRTLGYFETSELAYAAYCEKAKELFGEFFNAG